MENWYSLLEMFKELYLLNKVHSESQEIGLASLVGAYLHGATANYQERSPKPYGAEEYQSLLELVGDVNPSTKAMIPGKVKPLMIYNNGERIDFRVHRLLLFGTSMGKGREIAVMQKLLPELGISYDAVQKPTSALLLGRTERRNQGRHQEEFPIFPYLLYNDVIFMNECETLFKGKSDFYSEVPTILRNATDQFGDNVGAQLHNDSSSNTSVHPFYSRATIIAASYPSDRIKEEIAYGTLQRFFITSVSGDQKYTSKIIDAKISREQNVELKKIQLVSQICTIIKNSCDKVIAQEKSIVDRNPNPRHWYYKYDISNSKEYIEFLNQIKTRKENLGSGTDYEAKAPFYIRGIAHITKIACIVSIINGKLYGVGESELDYAMSLYFNNLTNVDTVTGITSRPRQRTADDKETLLRYVWDIHRNSNGKVYNKSQLVEAVCVVWGKPKKFAYKMITELEGARMIEFEKGKDNSSMLKSVRKN